MANEFNNQIDNSGFEPEQPEQLPLSKKRKIAAGVLAVFGIFILIMWTVQLKNSINGPFTYKGKSNNQNQLSSPVAEDSEEILKTKDSDKDGLSDWDELYLYKTSPYLEDSDSDGFTDKQEIDSNKDPNCPAGRDCGSLGIVNGDEKVVNQGEVQQDDSLLNNLLNQSGANQSAATTNLNSGAVNPFPGEQPNAATLRELLIQNGMQKNDLDKISDKDLMESYAETVKATE